MTSRAPFKWAQEHNFDWHYSAPWKPTRAYFERYHDAEIRPARRMDPDLVFLEWHSTVRFVDARA